MTKSEDNSILNLIKEIAVKAVGATNPCQFLYGTVTSISPLQIQLSSNLVLTREFLIIPKSLTDYSIEVEMDWNSEDSSVNTAHTHTMRFNDRYSIDSSEAKTITSESGGFNETHNHKIKGRQNITVYNSLKLKDKVILARVQGGQEFIIIDKVG